MAALTGKATELARLFWFPQAHFASFGCGFDRPPFFDVRLLVFTSLATSLSV
jgi:hypothetical protein